ncbi:acyl-CoA synthetase [Natronobacterium gregoryi]|uniref:AMP-dependent synthetase n=2 Tax=Natronobacterium gregoryi TaxID=44930 RepID=L0AFU8_NATGS|nr:AMP-binding protein [Natronobacterium gregoryi]AFZ72788.1 acyl-CoA synthetase/AMP-acid ligase [Natronobacterium gregoryi SP2]ELY69447.1 AMP-dependent synthetase and ligase [Natronobacterium gregoryi SP2]PLK21129.1 AMP-dependent synthetase [Natronobacterium gregoryi SP2]SFJ10738.1 acetyl-CoA synthetase [Natronobacterium gregoryi]
MGVSSDTTIAEFEWDVPTSYTVVSAVESHAETFGDRVAVRFRDEDGTRTERTYADVRDDTNRFANALTDHGVGTGDRVLHLFPRHPEAFTIQLGVLSTGALVVPCSSMLRPADVAFRANDCSATTIVVHESLTDMVEPVLEETPLERVIVLDGESGEGGEEGESGDDGDDDRFRTYESIVDGQPTEYDGPDLEAEDPMSINYTSGTTGKPKPVLHKHRWQYCFNRINAPYWWGIDEDTDLEDELLWATTGTGWAKWFWSPVGVGLTTGATQFVYDGEFDPETFLELLESEGVTRLCAVPTQYRMLANADLEAYDVDLTDALSAGEPLNQEPIERIEDVWGVTPRDGYGQTETVALVTNYPGIDVKPGSMGQPTPGVGATILGLDEDEPVDPGEIGEIAVPVDSPAIFDGYYEKPDLDERTLSGDYYRTGDLATRDEDGYFFFEGRADDVIISAGYRIGPFEVEDALVSHEAVAEAAAVDSPHEKRGSVVTAYVVLAEGYDGNDDLETKLQEYTKAETAPYKYPRRIEFVDELPKTASGKIRRVELRQEEREKHG